MVVARREILVLVPALLKCFSVPHLLCIVFLTQTQIMLARDSTGKKRFLVWESEENEFETLFKVLL